MNIDTNSWHYRLANFPSRREYDRARNLCEYIRHMLYGLLCAQFMVGVGVVAGLIIVVQPILNCFFGWDTKGNEFAFLGLVGAIFDAVLIFFIGFFWVQDKGWYMFWNWYDKKFQSTRTSIPSAKGPPSFLSIMFQWIRDKHGKLCRMVTYVEGAKES